MTARAVQGDTLPLAIDHPAVPCLWQPGRDVLAFGVGAGAALLRWAIGPFAMGGGVVARGTVID